MGAPPVLNNLPLPDQGDQAPQQSTDDLAPLPQTDPSSQRSIDPFAARPELIDSIIQHESSGRSDAVSPKGAKGLMQVMPQTAAQYGVTPDQLLNPEVNRQVGTRYFSDLLKQYKGNEWLALVAYNEGPTNLSKGRFFPESVKYATSVLDRAGSRLKGLFQGGESLLGIGGQGQQQPPQQQGGQPQAAGAPAGVPPPPGLLSRIGSGLSNFLEGTAYAEEPPGAPGAAAAPAASGATPPAAAAPPAGAPAAGPPGAPAGLPPLPTGAPTGGLTVDASGRPVPAAPPPGAVPGQPPGQPRPVLQHLTVDSNGRVVATLAPNKVPQTMQTQYGAGKIVMAQVDDALKLWDTNIKGKEKQFGGTLQQTPAAAIRGFMQYPEYTKSRYLEPLGLRPDPDVAKLYGKIGPVIGEQMKALIGGRIGQYMIDGPLAAHIPNGDRDSIDMIHEKLVNLKENVPIIIKQINDMKAAGMSEDQIIEQEGGQPVYDGTGNMVGYQ
jgi:hypothetical protein